MVAWQGVVNAVLESERIGLRMENALRAVGVMSSSKNGGTYFLTDLKVYADGMIDCWGLVDFTTFRQKVASGWVATTFSARRRGQRPPSRSALDLRTTAMGDGATADCRSRR